MKINAPENGEMYKYLGINEDIGYDGPLKKNRISKEFIRRAKKIWNSELYSRNNVKLSNHLSQLDEMNPLLCMVRDRERENIIRIGESVRQRYTSDDHHCTDYIKEHIKKEHFDLLQSKVAHGYLYKMILENKDVNVQATNQWLKSNMPSHVEGTLQRCKNKS